MTTTRQKIAVMEAYEAGRLIRFQDAGGKGDWDYFDNSTPGEPCWDWVDVHYEVVVAPRKDLYVTVAPDNQLIGCVYYSKGEARDAARKPFTVVAKYTFKEIIE